MKKSKAIQFLSTFSTSEMNRLEKYVNSPYFNTHKETADLFSVLKTFHPEFPEEEVKKERIFKKLYPGETFNESKLYVLGSYLYKLITEFLIEEEVREQKFERDYLALPRALDKHNLQKFIPKILKDGEKELITEPFKTARYFQHKLELAKLLNYHIMQEDNHSTKTEFQSLSDSLDYFYLIEKLRVVLAVTNQQLIIAENSDPKMIDEVLELYHSRSFKQTPLIDLFYFTFMMISREDGDEYFFKLRNLLSDSRNLMEIADANEVYNYAINHCARRYKQGEMKFLEEMFSLYKEMLDQDILFSKSPSNKSSSMSQHFKNLVTLGLKLGKYRWTESFIKSHGKRLPVAHQKGIISYNLANLYFTKGEFSKAQKHLMQVEFIDPFYRLNYDMLLLKIYYECDEVEPLLSRTRAFATFIQRNKSLSQTNRAAYTNMAKFVKKLAKAKFEKKGRGVSKIQDDLNACENLVERNWIQEKVEEMTT